MVLQGISVVTTTWNEAENIKELILRVRSALEGTPNEIIVIDDTSTDNTFGLAKQFADVAIAKVREGQTKGLLFGMQLAKYPIVVTIDADLENDPNLIPSIVGKIDKSDIVIASRKALPRFSEKWAQKTLGKIVGVSDFFSNFRAYKKQTISNIKLRGGETFGGELLVAAKKNGFRISETTYEPPPRRRNPRIGGKIKANFRILFASLKCFIIYLF